MSSKVPPFLFATDQQSISSFLGLYFGMIAGSEMLKFDTFEVTSWDMDATATYTLTPRNGIKITRILWTSLMINSDTTKRYDASFSGIDSIELDSTTSDILITRTAGGFFDNTSFNDTSVIRGDLTLAYTV